ncbi:MAG: protein kinase domain-containing protein [Bryobacteraceae bacterium]
MTPERRRQIEQLYRAALERPPERRSAFLKEAAGGDQDLRREVQSLLQQSADGELDAPLWQAPGDGPLKPGAQLGPYQILGPLGAGGMGAVYKARDTRLDRTVAIKVSSVRFSGRFEREARAIAALNHPNICTLHDIGPNYLVMELVEGQPLKGPLPLSDALRYAVQIADALDAAHRKGIVHRDLKPGNILVTGAKGRSTVKVLDFGLATIAVKPDDETQTGLTGAGTILGTLHYMSPEQVQGREAGARSDIFSFGAVLYEMIAGKRAFGGDNTASVISAIMTADPPPLRTLDSPVPAALERVVRRCVAKDPDDRWQTARDLEAELRWIVDVPPSETVPAGIAAAVPGKPKKWKRWLLPAAAVVALAAATWWAADRFARAPEPPQAVRSSLLPPPGFSFVPYQFALSPDGRHMAFVAVGADGRNTLWLRTLSASAAQQLSGAEDASFPFWSPDSHHVGFFAGEKFKIMDIAGGAVQIVSEALDGGGGSWSRDGEIVFAPDGVAGPLVRVPAAGGALAPATRLAHAGSSQAHRWPWFLPDGKHFLYFIDRSGPGDTQADGIYAGSLATPDVKPVLPHLKSNVIFASGNLLYVIDRSLMAQPFDPGKLETTGPAVPIAEQELEKDPGWSQSGFSASDNGLLVFQSAADAPARMTWFDAAGHELNHLPEAGYKDPSLSPDGRFLAVASDDAHNGKYFIRIIDLRRGIGTRLTDGGNEQNPHWTRDGRFITYQTTTNETASLNHVPWDGSSAPRTLRKGATMAPTDWSPDGHLAFMDFTKGPPDVAIYSAADGEVKDLGEGAEAQFSPDGKWIGYANDGIYVQTVQGPGGRIQISSNGGAQPRWSHDGKRLFYIQPDKKLMEVEFDAEKGTASVPRVLFQTRIVATKLAYLQYDVAPDGRFLINSFPSDSSAPLTLLTGWTALLKAH